MKTYPFFFIIMLSIFICCNKDNDRNDAEVAAKRDAGAETGTQEVLIRRLDGVELQLRSDKQQIVKNRDLIRQITIEINKLKNQMQNVEEWLKQIDDKIYFYHKGDKVQPPMGNKVNP